MSSGDLGSGGLGSGDRAASPATAPAPHRVSAGAVVVALLVDLALVLAFVAIGRGSHAREATLLGLLETAWPFAAGLAISWVAATAWKRPLAILRTGVPLWLGTVALGLLLRVLTGGGAATAFVIVTFVTLGVFLLGWRTLVALFRRLRRR